MSKKCVADLKLSHGPILIIFQYTIVATSWVFSFKGPRSENCRDHWSTDLTFSFPIPWVYAFVFYQATYYQTNTHFLCEHNVHKHIHTKVKAKAKQTICITKKLNFFQEYIQRMMIIQSNIQHENTK